MENNEKRSVPTTYSEASYGEPHFINPVRVMEKEESNTDDGGNDNGGYQQGT